MSEETSAEDYICPYDEGFITVPAGTEDLDTVQCLTCGARFSVWHLRFAGITDEEFTEFAANASLRVSQATIEVPSW